MSPRPGWEYLFAIVPLAVVAYVLAEFTISTLPLKTAIEAAIGLGTFGAMAWWARANRAALAQLDRCACAAEKTTVLVIRPGHRSRRPAAESLPVAVADLSVVAEEAWGESLGPPGSTASRDRWTRAKLDG